MGDGTAGLAGMAVEDGWLNGWLDGLLYWLALLAGWLGLLLTTRRVGQDMDCFDGLTAFPLTCEMALAG